MQDHTNKFQTFLNDYLNEIQLSAVKHKKGPMLIIAGAGSGKTRVITARIANLVINEQESPDSVLALTFTNKAASEMKERIHAWIQTDYVLPFIGTFHSFCLKILRTNRHLIEIPEFTILDDDDQLKMIQNLIQQYALNKKVSARQMQYSISVIKNNIALDQANIFSENKMIQEIYLAYEQERKASKTFDFDDLIIETIKLFKNNKEFKTRFQTNTKHILIDEYQDTSMIQHLLIKQLTQDENNKLALKSLCVVGDEDQSIYSWRGATVENIVYFPKDFKNTKVFKIEQNYRSVQPILEAANKVISNNKTRNAKKLWSDRQAKNRILHVSCMSEYKEGEMIAQAIKSIEKNKPLNSIAILYRTHFQSRAIEEALIKNSIAYTIIGGIQFYDRKEIKDIIAYLKLTINPYDRVSFFRVVNCPTRRLGEKFEEEFYLNWNNEPFLNFIDISSKLIEKDKLTQIKKDSLTNFINIIQKSKSLGLVDTINFIINETNYIAYLKASFDRQEAETKIDNVKEFIRAAYHFQEQGINMVSSFLEEITLMQQKMSNQDQAESKVQLMTLHAAKGLEFETVIISGLEEGLLPSSKSTQEAEIEEERRLFYVGITRAKEYLICSNVKYRNSFGQTNTQIPSRFLEELPTALVYREDSSSYYDSQQFAILFSQFLGNKQATTKVYTYGAAIKDKNYNLSNHNSTKEKWKKNQIVKHKQFGVGMIEKVENKDNGRIFITAKFKIGTKKIDSQFIENT